MKILCMNIKGGTGKTTTALLLGATLANTNSGIKVGLLDLDPQESGKEYVGNMGVVNFNSHSKEDSIVLVDTPPQMNPGINEHIISADVILVVLSPSPTDVIATVKTISILNDMKMGHKARLLFNRVELNTRLGDLMDGLKSNFHIKTLSNHIPKRISYAVALGEGYASIPRKDRDLIKDVAMEILMIK